MKKDWPYTPIEAEDYIKSYIDATEDYAKNFYIKDDKLIGVALVDILPKVNFCNLLLL